MEQEKHLIEAQKLCDYVDAFKGVKASVIGDLILDEYIWGSVNRVSPEAPIIILDVADKTYSLGGACNVAQNLATLGAEVFLSGVIGEDQEGVDCLSNLDSLGIDRSGVLVDSTRPTTKKTRLISQSQQLVRIDHETTDFLSSKIEEELYQKYHNQILSSRCSLVADYNKGVITPQLSRLLTSLRKQELIGFGSIPVLVDPKGVNYSNYLGATAIKPNKKEATQVTGVPIKSREDAIKVAQLIKEKWLFESVMVTLGDLGLILVDDKNEPFELDTIAQQIYDVSGAGDTVLAVFALGISVGASLVEASIIANCAAARVIREVGAVSIDPEELKEVIRFWEIHQ